MCSQTTPHSNDETAEQLENATRHLNSAVHVGFAAESALAKTHQFLAANDKTKLIPPMYIKRNVEEKIGGLYGYSERGQATPVDRGRRIRFRCFIHLVQGRCRCHRSVSFDLPK